MRRTGRLLTAQPSVDPDQMRRTIEIVADPGQLAESAADRILRSAANAVAAQGGFRVALSGGSTPRAAYAQLARNSQGLPWGAVHVFWGDERCVPPDHRQSNYRMARDNLLNRVPIPNSNVHRMRGDLDPEAAAQAYQHELHRVFYGRVGSPGRPPRFDLILLGLGRDGHTASLFPGSTALAQRRRWVMAQPPVEGGPWRLTLTMPVINAAAQVLFLVTGGDKAEIIRQVLHDPPERPPLPAQAVRPANGDLVWLLDAAAARLL